MYGTYIGNNKMLIKPIWGGFLLASCTDMSLMPTLVTNGVFDIPLTNYLIRNVKKGCTIIDAGANLGYFTILMGFLVGQEGKIIAYEADPKVFNILTDNLSLNGLDPIVTAFNKAVYSSESKIDFYISEKFEGNGSIQEHDDNYFKHFAVDKINKIEVETEPLDIYLNQLNFIDLIKLDIEGAEYDALLGMENLFKNKKVGTVVFELNRLMLRDKWQSLFALLNKYQEAYNFLLFTIDEKGSPIPTNLRELSAAKLTLNVIIKC